MLVFAFGPMLVSVHADVCGQLRPVTVTVGSGSSCQAAAVSAKRGLVGIRSCSNSVRGIVITRERPPAAVASDVVGGVAIAAAAGAAASNAADLLGDWAAAAVTHVDAVVFATAAAAAAAVLAAAPVDARAVAATAARAMPTVRLCLTVCGRLAISALGRFLWLCSWNSFISSRLVANALGSQRWRKREDRRGRWYGCQHGHEHGRSPTRQTLV
jgi:hypothetical protein